MSSSIQGREGECSGRSRRRKRKLRGYCGEEGGDWRTSEQGRRKQRRVYSESHKPLYTLHQLYLRVLLSKPSKVLILMEFSIYGIYIYNIEYEVSF